GAVACAQSDDIFGISLRNAAIQDGFAASANADLASEISSQPLIRGLTHELQRLANFLLRERVEEGGLFDFDGHRPFHSVVEYRIACGIFEVGEDDCIFFCKRMHSWCAQEKDGGHN